MPKVVRTLLLPLALATAVGLGLHSATAQDKKDKDKDKKDPKAVAVFEMYKDKSDEYRFRLKDDEGTLLCISGKGYEKKADCLKVIQEIRNAAVKAKLDDQSK
jgi:uncharacterized protein YegP (UPF0339 family)